MRLERVITALFLISRVSSLMVPPPENVTVICQNLKTTVYWKYSKDQPQTTFRVNIIGSAGNYANETKGHQYDLSRFVWQSEENYLSFLYVTVTAIQEGNQSEAVSSNTFSFNDLKTVDTKCVLDFPNIDVISDDTGTSVEFQNPLYFYEELKQTIRPHSPPKLKFIVSPVGGAGDFDGVCEARQSFCKHLKTNVMFPEGVEKCVTLKGLLFDGMGVYQVIFRKTEKICATTSDETLYLAAVILGSIFAVIILMVVIAICKVKAWTMQKEELPECLKDFNAQNKNCKSASNEEISPLTYKSHESPSGFSEDNIRLQDDSTASGSGPSDRYFSGEREELLGGYNQEEMTCGACRMSDDDADGSQETECISVDSEDADETARSPYDFGHNEIIDMGGGDIVSGYTG